MRYARHPLGIDEVRQHIKHGKLPTRLAMTWEGRVSFVLAEGFQIKNSAVDATMDRCRQDDGGFDTDVSMATGELSSLIPDLMDALGQKLAPADQPLRDLMESVKSEAGLGRPKR